MSNIYRARGSGSVLRALRVRAHFVLTAPLWDKYSRHPHLTEDKKRGIWRLNISSRISANKMAKAGLDSVLVSAKLSSPSSGDRGPSRGQVLWYQYRHRKQHLLSASPGVPWLNVVSAIDAMLAFPLWHLGQVTFPLFSTVSSSVKGSWK